MMNEHDNDINREVMDAISILMEDSFWGKTSNTDSLMKDFDNEVLEFKEACKKGNYTNAIEEASDVTMIMLCALKNIERSGQSLKLEDILNGVVEKLKRRYAHLYTSKEYNGNNIDEQAEYDIWNANKKIENTINYMFCDNIKCNAYLAVGKGNIEYRDNRFQCSFCMKNLQPSSKNVLFFRKKERRECVEKLSDAVLRFALGYSEAIDEFRIENHDLFVSFIKEIQSNSTKQTAYCNYISEMYQINESKVQTFFEMSKYAEKSLNIGLSEYCRQIDGETYNMFDILSDEGKKSIINALKSTYMDIIERVYNVSRFSARSWNNQTINKYLMAYRRGDRKRILEAMVITHYCDDTLCDVTIELSNMYNCIVGCDFCASAALPEQPVNLEPIDYVRQLNTCIKESGIEPKDFQNFYVSFAGIGEPSAVYKSIAKGMFMILDLYDHVKFNIATFGFDCQCFTYWDECNLPIRTLQIPYYSGDNTIMKTIVKNLPDNYDFDNVIKAAVEYHDKHPECRVKVNYLVMKNKNNNEKEIADLVSRVLKYREVVAIKVSFLNYTRPGAEKEYVSPGMDELQAICKKLQDFGITSYVFGSEINQGTGCGQLVQHHISIE